MTGGFGRHLNVTLKQAQEKPKGMISRYSFFLLLLLPLTPLAHICFSFLHHSACPPLIAWHQRHDGGLQAVSLHQGGFGQETSQVSRRRSEQGV
eukprot:652417-Hanusia_phi.AAC.4